jgi:regulation of enolase protein 1 (concanavalin A-like superfamily)
MTGSGAKTWEGAWLNPPPEARVEDGVLHARSGPRTDFWRHTHYGFVRDDGHALLRPAPAEFTVTLAFEGAYRTLYDQAGLMLRSGPEQWVKFGVELTDGAPHLSAVVTQGRSDWSATPLALRGPLEIRMIREGGALLLQHRAGGAWATARLAPFGAEAARVGPYLCSPEREGFEAAFHRFSVGPPVAGALHG